MCRFIRGYYHMWQYTSGGSVDGIEGRVDFNLSYLRIEGNADNMAGDIVQKEEDSEEEIDEADLTDEEIEEPKPIQGAVNAER